MSLPVPVLAWQSAWSVKLVHSFPKNVVKNIFGKIPVREGIIITAVVLHTSDGNLGAVS